MAGIGLAMFLDRAAQLYPNTVATQFNDQKQTWANLASEASRLSGGLRELGVLAGDRIAILALNSNHYFSLFYAAWRIGAAIVPLNTRWSSSENRFALEDAEPKVLFVDTAFAGQVDALALPSLTIVYMGDGDTPAALLPFGPLLLAEPVADVGAGGADMAGIFFTGGTTGRPKGAMLSHEGLAISLLASGLYVEKGSPPQLLTVLPLFHLSGAQQVIGAAMRGSTVRILASFDVLEVLRFIEAEKITQLSLVPSMWAMVLNHPDYDRYDVSSLEAALYGAAPMPEGVVRAAITKLPKAGFAQGYGQTETSGITTLLGPEDHAPDGPHSERLRSAGKTLPFAQVKVADDHGVELARTAVGELWVRGPHVMLGYWRRPKETAETLIGGWVRTGDAAYMDPDGYVFIVDRVKDMIISGGENIFSGEVETVLSLHPAVLDCAVVGAPDPKWGEKVVAIIRPKPGMSVDLESVVEFCRGHIAGYKCPREILIRDEPFPLSAAGKVLKRDLREPFWRGHARSVN
jgi:acyl-CoA synthetase (AMP-forming)/AMP-acid ligase II